MSIRAWAMALISLIVNLVLFGIGVIAVMYVPTFNREALMFLPICALASFAITPMIIGFIAPKLGFWRDTIHHG